MLTCSPSTGLSGEVEDAVGEDGDEVVDGDEGELSLLGLTSTSFFSFRSTCLLFVPEDGEQEDNEKLQFLYAKLEQHNLFIITMK